MFDVVCKHGLTHMRTRSNVSGVQRRTVLGGTLRLQYHFCSETIVMHSDILETSSVTVQIIVMTICLPSMSPSTHNTRVYIVVLGRARREGILLGSKKKIFFPC